MSSFFGINNIKYSLFTGLMFCSSVVWGQSSPTRPAQWAQQVVNAPFKNLYRLNDSLYRSEQPNGLGLQVLDSLGIKSILNLRLDNSDASIPGADQFKLYSIKMHPYNLKSSEIKQALQIIVSAPKPLLIHCKHGADRTGAVIAFYRILIAHWSREEAILEMKKGGYGFHKKYFNIPLFIKRSQF